MSLEKIMSHYEIGEFMLETSRAGLRLNSFRNAMVIVLLSVCVYSFTNVKSLRLIFLLFERDRLVVRDLSNFQNNNLNHSY